MKSFKSLKVSYIKNKHSFFLENNNFRQLKNGEVLVKVKYSGINYKDAISVTGKNRIIKCESLIPGLDFSGTVIESNSKNFSKGQKVLATGSGLGEAIDGGFTEYAYVSNKILIHIPNNLTPLSAMQIGTAGFTAAIAIDKMILNKQKVNYGPILVTGATGSVGSISINILNNIGFETIALTRKINSLQYLEDIGAKKIIKFNSSMNKKILNNKFFAGAIDNIGGEVLDWIIKSTKNDGNIVSVGMASDSKLNTTVFPMIMRSVNILGVSSTNYSSNRKTVWKKLSSNYKPKNLNKINTQCIELKDVLKFSKKIIAGKNIGKVVVKIS